jgi:hypothetical protein
VECINVFLQYYSATNKNSSEGYGSLASVGTDFTPSPSSPS